jgi:transposase
MVVVGVDVHKRSHTFVAVNEIGRKLGQLTVTADSAGHQHAVRWAHHHFGVELLWAIEDCRQLSTRLERDLLSGGQRITRVPPKLMAGARRSVRTPGKSDPIDALAVARVALREPDLPVVSHDEVSREFKLLVDRRESLVAQRTCAINQLRWHLHELDPAAEPGPRTLDRISTQHAVAAWLSRQHGMVARIATDELADVIRLTTAITALTTEIAERVMATAPALMSLPGCGALTAAKLIGETAGITRFHSEAAFARHAGIAPVPIWSGDTAGRVRLTRSGNRQINTAVHRIGITQIRLPDCAGHTYYAARRADGKQHKEALRCLKRHIARTIYHLMQTDHAHAHPAAA